MSKKIKILKTEGLDEATVSWVYDPKLNPISGLEAYAYNLVDGKIEKTKLDRKYIYNTEFDSKRRQLKFSFPGVKVGTVIEFKYQVTFKSFFSLPDWWMQGKHPVVYSLFKVAVPEYFMYNMQTRGYERIDHVKKPINMKFMIAGNPISCQGTDYSFEGHDIPALRNESYVWCPRDFMAGVSMELSGTKFPNDFYKSYSTSWDDVDKTLNDNTDILSNTRGASQYKKEIDALLVNEIDERVRIEKIYDFVKGKVKWNRAYGLFENNPREAVKDGTGNNAQINSLLIRALTEQDIKTYPVFMSRRSRGRLPYGRGSLEALNTYVVAAETAAGEIYYLDGSATFGGLNVLPPELLVDRARAADKKKSEKWVDLTDLSNNSRTLHQIAVLDSDGTIQATIMANHTGQYAMNAKRNYAQAKDSTDFADNYLKPSDVDVDSISFNGIDPASNTVTQYLQFHRQYTPQGEFLYINPMIIPHITENRFMQSERKLPIEFDYPYTFQLVSTISIPDDYEIEEIPQSAKYTMIDGYGSCLYHIGQHENMIQLNYKFELKRILYPNTSYDDLKIFFGQVVARNNDVIVLKKRQ